MEQPVLKSSTALFFQIVVVVAGLATLVLMLGEPHLEGRNARATAFEIYFKDPFLAYAYVGSIPFFMVLHRLFEILGQLRRNGTLPPEASHGFRSIKRCALTCIGFVAGGIVFILLLGDPDDRPAGLFMSLLVAVPGMVVASAAAMFERKLRNAST